MKVLVQNLQKRNNLATQLIEKYDPDVILAQEISLYSESNYDTIFEANYVSSMGYGTAIGLGHNQGEKEEGSTNNITQKFEISDIKKVHSPYAEFGSMIYKKTTIATITCTTTCTSNNVSSKNLDRVELISFHGYNGQPFKNKEKLVAHVKAVIDKISPTGPALFAGDFNTWSKEHLDAVSAELENVGFRLVFSWPYPNREVPLDNAFFEGLRA